MEVIVKSFIGIFCLLLLTVTGIGITSASVASRNADSFLSSCVERMEASHYAKNVVEACQADAKTQNYDLQVEWSTRAGKERAAYGNVALTYVYGMPFFDLENTRVLHAELW